MQDRPHESKRQRYLRLAQEAAALAKIIESKERCALLLQMAHTWLRLADESRDD